MFAVVCDPAGDAAAVWAVGRLRRRLGPVVLVPIDLLARAPGLVLSIGDAPGADDGSGPREAGTCARLPLADGRRFGPETTPVVLNRASRAPQSFIGGGDAVYAAEECWATALAFLAAFGRGIVNAPHPAGLAGRERRRAEWLHLAALAGLPTCSWQDDALVPEPPAGRGLVIGDAVFGLPSALAGPLVTLARLAELELMGVDLDRRGRVTQATHLPDLRLGGEVGIEALAALLMARAAAAQVRRS